MDWHRPPLFNPDNFFAEDENIFPNIISVNMLCLHRSRQQISGLREVTGTDYHPLAGRGDRASNPRPGSPGSGFTAG